MTSLAIAALGLALMGFLWSIVAYHTAEKGRKELKTACKKWETELSEMLGRTVELAQQNLDLTRIIDQQNTKLNEAVACIQAPQTPPPVTPEDLTQLYEELVAMIDSRELEQLKNDEWKFNCPVCGKLNKVFPLRGNDQPQEVKLHSVCTHCGIPVGNPEIVRRALKDREKP